MKIEYKNRTLENVIITLNCVAIGVVATTFVMLFGFDIPPLSRMLLRYIDGGMFFFFFTEKVLRYLNAASKRDYFRMYWFEIPLLAVVLFAIIGAGRWYTSSSPREFALDAVSVYLVFQVIDKLCRGIVMIAAAGHNPARSLIVMFMILILSGAGLLMLPKAHNLESMSFTNAVFTATSATCVTGLTVMDTGGSYSFFGEVVILFLIQLGGLGIVIFGAVLAMMLGQSFTVRESAAMQDLLSEDTLNRIARMIGFIFISTLVIETAGAVLLYPMWDNVPGIVVGIQKKWWASIFHSVSAFCNAGFGLVEQNLIDYNRCHQVYTVIAPLIILGGLGFSVLYNLADIGACRVASWFRKDARIPDLLHTLAPKRLTLQTKIVLSVTAFLIVSGTLLLWLFEYYSPNLQTDKRWCSAFFQSVSARTAGFNSVDIGAISEGSKLSLILLMFIGGSPGSTAGGIKTTTFAVVVMVVIATLRKRHEVELFKRSIRLIVIGRAITIVVLYIAILLAATLALSITERQNHFSLLDMMFEVTSAIGTVGLSTGITASLTTAGKWIIITTMLIGRLGPLTLLTAMLFSTKPGKYEYPSEPLVVG
jgi:trk system potassium uptake protein TrkH